MNKLVSMTDFVLEIANSCLHESYEDDLIKIYNYANLLKQPLELWMFVPCDDEGNVLYEPEFHEPNNENEIGDYDELRYEYQKAKERCLFDGFELDYDRIVKNNEIRIQFNDYSIYLNNSKTVISTIEDIIEYNLELTPTTQKQLGI